MTMRLVCDHCEGVINDAEFREVRRSVMMRDPADPMAGTSRAADETFHYHTLCLESRVQAAVSAQFSAASARSEQIPDDHPLRKAEADAADAHQDRIRVGSKSDRSNEAEDDMLRRRERLEDMSVDELRDLARQNEIEGRSDMKKAELVDALLGF